MTDREKLEAVKAEAERLAGLAASAEVAACRATSREEVGWRRDEAKLRKANAGGRYDVLSTLLGFIAALNGDSQ